MEDHMKYIINRLTVKGKGMKIGVCSNVIDSSVEASDGKDMMTPDWRLWTNAVYKNKLATPIFTWKRI